MSELVLDSDFLINFDRIGVAFSGGLDSTVLLQVIGDYPSLKRKCTALHINHGLQELSDDWEKICEDKALSLGISFKSWKLKNLQSFSENSMRDERLKIFENWVNDNDIILTGHHLEDQTETILFRIFRGTGLKGLKGISKTATVKNINFHRPFLEKSKKDLLLYAEEKNLNWVEDPSNKESYFSRNKIRNDLIPNIESRWPFINKSITKLSEEAEKGNKILHEVAQEDYSNTKIHNNVLQLDTVRILSKARQENLIRFWLKDENKLQISSGQIDQILRSISKSSRGTREFLIKGDEIKKIILSSKEIQILNHEPKSLPIDLCINWDFKDSIKIPSGELSVVESFGKGLDKKYIGLNAEIRARVGGEKCKPFGRDKSQKLKNLFQEFEIPDWKRSSIPLIYLNNEIAAVGDLWICEDFHTESDDKGISIVWKIT